MSDAEPRIVFISQLGTGGVSWKPVIDRMPGHAVFTYDRPGTGDGPGRPAPNPPLPHSAFARELADLLDAEGITEPAVIVGHSFGGNIARVYAGHRPERVAGLVFVDCSIPQTFLVPDDGTTIDGDGPDATQVDTVGGQVDILSAAIPAVPTVVLARTRGRWDGESPPPHPRVEDLWRVSQQLLARQWQAPLIVADNSGHQMPREAPELVTYAVETVADAARHARRRVWPDVARLHLLGAHLDDGPGSGLPVGSIVATYDSALFHDRENDRFPWKETAGFSVSDDSVAEMLRDGHAIVVRVGYDGAPPLRQATDE